MCATCDWEPCWDVVSLLEGAQMFSVDAQCVKCTKVQTEWQKCSRTEREIEGVSGIRRSSSCCSRFKQRRRKDLPDCVETDGWYLFSDEQHVGVDYVFLTEDVDFSGRHPSEYFKHTSLSQGAVCNLKKQWLQSAVKWKDGAAATQCS